MTTRVGRWEHTSGLGEATSSTVSALLRPHPFLALAARAARSSIIACHGGVVQQALLAIGMAARQSVGDWQGPGRTVSAERQDDRYEGRRRPGRER